ncbi:MAG: bifunctional riboflavin kinase/FAD synthetase [Clostridia bacterium]|nr:bifunctional riboflavin kinase/FAD synthetase [Clostridia bacterium]
MISLINKDNKGSAVALGNFDGMHIGHIAVLDKTAELSQKGLTATVMLFDEHSLKGVTGEAPPALMTEQERIKIIQGKGLDFRVINFSDIKNLTPREFVEEVLIGEFNAKAVVCGFNYRFGCDAKGDVELLDELCKANGIECITVDEVLSDSRPVSSTAIRRAIEAGNIELANKMLGRQFGFTSKVIDGDKRGRTWGFPTANQKLPDGLTVPLFGVYESIAIVDGKTYKGVTNIGSRPTVGTQVVLSETHIIEFNSDLYGKDVVIRLVRFIRPEQKFSSFDELVLQIKSDVENAKGGV